MFYWIKTDKSLTEYRALTKVFAYRPTLSDRAISLLSATDEIFIAVLSEKDTLN